MTLDLTGLPKLTRKLLPRFIAEKLADYTEPSKKGVPKGDPVGFSRTKYHATLLALRQKLLADEEGLEEQAKELKVSYGVLRKWRSEQQFKEMVAQREKEFLGYLLSTGKHRDAGEARDPSARIAAVHEELIKKSYSLEQVTKNMSLADIETEKNILLAALAQTKRNIAKAEALAYQTTALENAIAILKNRDSAIKHRKEIVAVLQSVRDSLH
jgi:hypothetical protein